MTSSQPGDLIRAARLILDEARRASGIFPAFNSAHEGKAVIEEELDELWDEIKKKPRDQDAILEEAIQLGAMAVRFIADVCFAEEERHGPRTQA